MASSVTRHLAKPIYRGQLTTRPANGHTTFIPQIRKVVFEYCEKWPTSQHTRTFLANNLQEYARKNPHVEFVIKQRNYREPIIRGLYRAFSLPSASGSRLMRVVSEQQRKGHLPQGL
jgi:large subunit ribosomal protein L43